MLQHDRFISSDEPPSKRMKREVCYFDEPNDELGDTELAILEEVFQTYGSQRIPPAPIKGLVDKIGLEQDAIHKWFRTRRQAEKARMAYNRRAHIYQPKTPTGFSELFCESHVSSFSGFQERDVSYRNYSTGHHHWSYGSKGTEMPFGVPSIFPQCLNQFQCDFSERGSDQAVPTTPPMTLYSCKNDSANGSNNPFPNNDCVLPYTECAPLMHGPCETAHSETSEEYASSESDSDDDTPNADSHVVSRLLSYRTRTTEIDTSKSSTGEIYEADILQKCTNILENHVGLEHIHPSISFLDCIPTLVPSVTPTCEQRRTKQFYQDAISCAPSLHNRDGDLTVPHKPVTQPLFVDTDFLQNVDFTGVVGPAPELSMVIEDQGLPKVNCTCHWS